METFWFIMKFILFGFAFLTLVLALLIFLPQSPVNKFIKKHGRSFSLAFLIVSVLYLLSPIDIIPDMIPALGQVDDLGALLLAIMGLISNWKQEKTTQQTNNFESSEQKGASVNDAPIKEQIWLNDDEKKREED